MPYPTGSRVTILAVDHLIPPHKHQHLIGKTGTVLGHENGMNLVTGLTRLGPLVGQAFTDEELALAPSDGKAHRNPRYQLIRRHLAPNR